jgi:hypothetical protein
MVSSLVVCKAPPFAARRALDPNYPCRSNNLAFDHLINKRFGARD